MTLDRVARRLLPSSLYERVAASLTARRLARGTFWSLLGTAVSRLLALVGMILAARLLGKASFGELGLIQATLGVFGILAGVGLGNAATRFVAQFAQTDPDRAGRIIGLLGISAALSVSVTAILLIALADLLALSILDSDHLKSALIWGTLLMSVSAFRGLQNGTLAGLECFDVVAKLSIIEAAASLPALVVLAALRGVEGALVGLALGSTVAWTVGRFMLAERLRVRGITPRHRGVWGDWRILTGYSLPSVLAHSAAIPILWFAMTLVARSEEGYAGLGLYLAAQQWHVPLVYMPMILMGVSMPVLVQAWEGGQHLRFRKVFLYVSAAAMAVPLLAALVLAPLSPWIMSLYGPDFREGWLVLVLMLAAAPLHAVAKISSAALLGMNRAWLVLFANLAWGCTLLGMTMILLGSLGVVGLAVAFLVAYLVLAAITSAMVLVRSGLLTGGLSTKPWQPQKGNG